jgi:serine/threonine-protein kinase
VLDRYRIAAFIGAGTTGLVFRAIREEDDVPVALKVLRTELSRDEIFRRRFAREARAAREVSHPHIVPVLDAGTASGRHYLAMRYFEGHSLAVRLAAAGPLALSEVLRLAAEIGAALDALHRCGLVHRDVKPGNILRDELESAALTDFGLAKGRAYTVLTKPGQLIGTVDYLAPEVIRGEGASAASDIYGLGCVIFSCLAGRPPFAGSSPLQVTVRHLHEDPPDPCTDRDDAPPGLAEAVLHALDKDASRRPPTARAYALAIWRAAGSQGLSVS